MSSGYSQPPLVIAKVTCAKLTCYLTQSCDLENGLLSTDFVEALRDYRFPFHLSFFQHNLRYQGAAHSNTHMFIINLHSLQAHSLSKGPRPSAHCSPVKVSLCAHAGLRGHSPSIFPLHAFLLWLALPVDPLCSHDAGFSLETKPEIFPWCPAGCLCHPAFPGLCSRRCYSREEDGKPNAISVHWS